jgi:hypothetical protein
MSSILGNPPKFLSLHQPPPVAEEFNRVFGWQTNLWLKVSDIIIHDQSHEPYEDHADYEGDEVDDSGRTLDTRSAAFAKILSSCQDPSADFKLILIDRVRFKDEFGGLDGFRPPPTNAAFVVTADPENPNRPLETICANATHEFGHVIISPHHPDKDAGPAPLQHTDRTERLMYSGNVLFNRRLVKAEWDKIEEWAKKMEEDRENLN